MRPSYFISALLCLFPVLISGHPMMRRDNSSSNSTVSTDPSNGNSTLNSNSTSLPTDSGSGNSTTSIPSSGANSTTSLPSSGANSTSPIPPTDGSNSTTSNPSDGSGNSTSSDPTGDSTNSSSFTDQIALDLMSLITTLKEEFYDAAIVISNDKNEPTLSALFAIAQFLNGKDLELLNGTNTPSNCQFELNKLLDANLTDIVTSAAYLEGFTLMAVQALLQNASIFISSSDQDGLNSVILDASTLLKELGNATVAGTPLTAVPLLTLADVGNFIRKYKPSCDSPPLVLDNLPATNTSPFTTPFTLRFGESLVIGNTGCANPNATAFCQVISDDPTANTTVTPVSDCVVGTKTGTNLWYITDNDTPLPSDPQERVKQQSGMCTGPDFFFVLNKVN